LWVLRAVVERPQAAPSVTGNQDLDAHEADRQYRQYCEAINFAFCECEAQLLQSNMSGFGKSLPYSRGN
jgi:hypothetical protein